MMSHLEQILINRNAEEENFLYVQWRLSKTYVKKVQAVISHVFPHFSLHDDSHSETILSRVESLIGKEELEKLSTTDVWLMLSAAYYHDVGMAVMADDLEKIFSDEKFQDGVKSIQQDATHPLNPFALLYEVKSDGLHYKPEKLCGKTFDAARFLLADFVRKSHAARSCSAIAKDSLLHLKDTPIPGRIIDYLGRICECHGMYSVDVMALPKEEMGALGDICHPRFIASMLRLGDLLDIDNDRFSDVLLCTLSHIPEDSLRHKEKHLSLKRFLLNTKHLELMAECKDYDVYDITDQWFNMIKEELMWQRNSWSNIVPEEITSSLPVIDQLEIRLKDYDIVDDKKKPEFTIKTTKAIDLLQGAGIYKHKVSSIKELLQNAVDATNISLYLSSIVEGYSLSIPDDLYDISDKRPINVRLTRKKEDGVFVYWKISIEDKGVGMSKDDMKYLLQIGSRNVEKQKIVDKMPEFMKPSGSFGIGFQSVFLLTDEVEIESWKQNTNNHLTAMLYNPAGIKKGRVILKTDDTNTGKHGTIIGFTYKVRKVPSRITYSASEPLSTKVAGEYDFVKDETLDYEIAKVVEEIQHFGVLSQYPINLSIDGNAPVTYRLAAGRFDYYSKEQGIQLKVYDGIQYMSRLFFKNQLVDFHVRKFVNFLALDVNILTGDAQDILTLNRTGIREGYKKTLDERIVKAVTEYLGKKKWKKSDKHLQALAVMFLRQYYTKDEVEKLDVDWLDKWKDYLLTDKKTSFGSIVKQCSKATVRIIMDNEVRVVTYLGKTKDNVTIKSGYAANDAQPLYFLLGQLLETHPYVTFTSFVEDGVNRVCFELSKNERALIENWKGWFQNYKQNVFSARGLMPCNEKYVVLKVEPNKYWSVNWTFPWEMEIPLMICPYTIKRTQPDILYGFGKPTLVWDDCEEKLYQMTYNQRADKSVTMEQIRDAYKDFRKETEAFI